MFKNAKSILFLFLTVIMISFPNMAKAQCVSPDGQEGDQLYNVDYKVMQFCDGVNWKSMHAQIQVLWHKVGDDLYYDNGKVAVGTNVFEGSGLRVVGSGSIADTGTLVDAWLLVGSESSGIGMDNNELYVVGNDFGFGTLSANSIGMFTSSTLRLSILATGEVGIGEPNPTTELEVAGDITSDGVYTDYVETTDIAVNNTVIISGIEGSDYIIGDDASTETNGIVLRTTVDPATDGENLFSVQSSDFGERLSVEHNGYIRSINSLYITGTTNDNYFAGNIATDGTLSATGATLSNLNTAGFVINSDAGVLGTQALIDLESDVTGVLPVANGGTGLNAIPAANQVLYSDGSNIVGSTNLTWNGSALSTTGDVNIAANKSLRLWGASDSYRIRMGNAAEFQYGPVTDYSIKTFMSNTATRGWTWGVSGLAPKAALSTGGIMQIASTMTASSFIDVNGTSYFLDPANTGKALNVAGDIDTNDKSLYLRDTTDNVFGIGLNAFGGTELTIFSDNTISFTETDGSAVRATYSMNNPSWTFDGGTLHIDGNDSGSYPNRVGIGTTTPGYKLDVAGNFRVSTPGSSWLSGKTGSGGINAGNAQNGTSYFPVLRQTTSSGHVVNLGGLGNEFGFYSYKTDRTVNGYDFFAGVDAANNRFGVGTRTPSFTLDVAGAIGSTGDHHIIEASPTIYLRDTDHRSAMIHNNSNLLYVLRGDGSNTTTWTQYNSVWPFVINLENNDVTIGARAIAESFVDRNGTGYYLNPADTGTSLLVAGGATIEGLSTAGFVTNTAAGVLGTQASIDLESDVSGTLPVANGGTGLTAVPDANQVLYSDGSTLVGDANLTWNGSDLAVAGSATLTTGSLNLNFDDSLYFESGKHLISYNDGKGNFNIRVGHDAAETVTEAYFPSHMEWSQGSATAAGSWSVNFDQDSDALSVGGALVWDQTLKFTSDGKLSATGDIVAGGALSGTGATLSDFTTAGFVTNTAAGVLGTQASIDLASDVSGTLPVANGGTGLTAVPTANQVLYSDGSTLVGDANLTWNGSKLNVAGEGGVTGKLQVGSSAVDNEPASNDWNYTLQLNGLDTTSIGFHDAGSSVSSIRYDGSFRIGYDDGWGVKNTLLGGDLTVGGSDIMSGGQSLTFMKHRADDTTYEWLGYYSGSTRQAIMLYDGSWSGCSSSTSEFCIKAENSNSLSLYAADDVILMPTNYVGVGTTSPAHMLDVNGTLSLRKVGGVSTLDFPSGDTDPGYIKHIDHGSDTAELRLSVSDNYTNDVDTITFGTTNGGTFYERMRITAGGKVGIGATAPSSLLSIGSNGASATALYVNSSGHTRGIYTNGSAYGIYAYSSDGYGVYASTPANGTAGYFNNSSYSNYALRVGTGKIQVGNTSSNARLMIAGTEAEAYENIIYAINNDTETTSNALNGRSDYGSGTYGYSSYGNGIYGRSSSGTGVYALSSTGNAGYFVSGYRGLYVDTDKNSTGTGYGIYNDYDTGTTSSSSYGIYSNTDNDGTSTGYGIYNYLNNSSASGGAYGFQNYIYQYSNSTVYGIWERIYAYGTGVTYGAYYDINKKTTSGTTYGVYADVDSDSSSSTVYGIYATADSQGSNAYGVYARGDTHGVYATTSSASGYGGYFSNSATGGFGLAINDGFVRFTDGYNSSSYMSAFFHQENRNFGLLVQNDTTGSVNAYGIYGKGIGAGAGSYGVYGWAGTNGTGSEYGVYCYSYYRCGGNKGWTNTSDRRLKEDIKDLDLGLDFVTKLRPVSFKWKTHSGKVEDKSLNYGFIAQEVLQLLGDEETYMVAGDKVNPDEKEILKYIDEDDIVYNIGYTEMIAPLVKAVQEQQEQIEILKEANNNKEEENKNLLYEIEMLKKDVQDLKASVAW